MATDNNYYENGSFTGYVYYYTNDNITSAGKYRTNNRYEWYWQSGWLAATYTFTGIHQSNFPIYNINQIIQGYEGGPSGAEPPDVYDRLVSHTFHPDLGVWMGSGFDQFYLREGGEEPEPPYTTVRVTGYDNQRPWQIYWQSKVITNNFNSGLTKSFQISYTGFTGDSGRIIPEEHVLLVYNDLCPASIELKDYYTGARTGLKGLNILSISCDSGQFAEVTTTGNYVNNIRDPIWYYIRNTPKPIKYCILMYGIPTYMTGDQVGDGIGGIWTNSNTNPQREPLGEPYDWETYGHGITGTIHGDLQYSMYFRSGYARHPNFEAPQWTHETATTRYNYTDVEGASSGHFVGGHTGPNAWREYTFGADFAQTFLVTHIFADNTADVSGYIHKITGHSRADGVYLRGTGTNTGALFSSATRPESYGDNYFLQVARMASGHFTGLNDLIVHQTAADWLVRTTYAANRPQITGTNINMFLGWGIHTNDSNAWPWGQIQQTSNTPLSGDNNWFIISHQESYGAQNRAVVPYGAPSYKSYWFMPPYKQFASDAYGGEDYSNVPVGWLSHILEPGRMYWTDSTRAYQMWISGEPFINVAQAGATEPRAWRSDYGKVIIGDPFVTCF